MSKDNRSFCKICSKSLDPFRHIRGIWREYLLGLSKKKKKTHKLERKDPVTSVYCSAGKRMLAVRGVMILMLKRTRIKANLHLWRRNHSTVFGLSVGLVKIQTFRSNWSSGIPGGTRAIFPVPSLSWLSADFWPRFFLDSRKMKVFPSSFSALKSKNPAPDLEPFVGGVPASPCQPAANTGRRVPGSVRST